MSDIDYQAILPQGWPRPRGYSQAATARGATQVRIAGQIAGDSGGPVPAGLSLGQQWRGALDNLVTVVRAAGGDVGNIVALRAYVLDIDEFNTSLADMGAAWSATLGRHFPPMTLVAVAALLDPHARVEIEAEAILP